MSTSAQFSRKYWLKLVAFTALISAIALSGALAYLVHRQLIIFTTARHPPLTKSPADFELPFEDVTLTTTDGLKLAGWYISGTRPHAIILVHGINANRAAMLPTAALLAEAGYPLLLIDQRGHGKSEGLDVTYGYKEALDVQAAADYLDTLPEIEKIGALGTSMGGATVARAAAIDPRLQAVVIQSSYSSLPNAVEDAFDDLSIFPKYPFAPLIVWLGEQRVGVKIGQVDSMRDLATVSPRSVMIIHGNIDGMFPVHHAYKMYEAAHEPKKLWVIEQVTHADPIITHKDEYRAQVVSFFEEAFAR